MNLLKNLFKPKPVEPPAPVAPVARVPEGQRVYAIGDIHGRCDLFVALAEAVEADNAARAAAASTVVLLGDLIDRGPDSRGVLTIAREWQRRRDVRILLGNHEEMMLESLERVEVLKHFARFGGKETMLSFGVCEAAYNEASWEEVQEMLTRAVPDEVIAFVRGFEDRVRIGDYLFVHAGIAPGVEFDAQNPADLRWIREPFLGHEAWHGAVVVHGHTISEDPQLRDNRIGIDTGAYASGVLTALGLEGESRWLISARAGENGIETFTIAA